MVRYWKHRGNLIAKLVEPHVEKYFPYHKPELERVSPFKALLTGKVAKAPFNLAFGQVEPFKQSLHPSYTDIIKYFYQTVTRWVHTQGIKTNIGDLVLIEKTDQPVAFNTTYVLKRVEFPVGQMVDPVTGLKISSSEYTIQDLEYMLSDGKTAVKDDRN